jgi:hypothetical protein
MALEWAPQKDDTLSCNEGHSFSLSTNHPAWICLQRPLVLMRHVTSIGSRHGSFTHGSFTWDLLWCSSQTCTPPELWYLSWPKGARILAQGIQISPASATPGLKTPTQSLGHDCCATMDQLCSRLLLLTLPDNECSTSLPFWWKSSSLIWMGFTFFLCYPQGSCFLLP